MSERGPNVYAVSRAIWDDPDFADEAFSEREAWLWLVGAAAWKDLRTRGSTGAPIALRRGEFSFSIRFLAEKWGWSKSTVDRFMTKLEKRDMVRDASRDSGKVYSIRNYNKFQVVGTPKRDRARDADRDASGTDAGQHRDKEETGETGEAGEISDRPKRTPPLSDPQSGSDGEGQRNGRKSGNRFCAESCAENQATEGQGENPSPVPRPAPPKPPATNADGFERFWQQAEPPKHAAKAAARAAWAKTHHVRPPDDVLIAAHAAYRASVAAENAKRRQERPPRAAMSLCHPVTFLVERRWENFLDAAKDAPAPVSLPPDWGVQGAMLAEAIGPTVFAQWFEGATLTAGPPVTIAVDKRFKQRWIEDHFRQVLARVFGDDVRIVRKAEALAA